MTNRERVLAYAQHLAGDHCEGPTVQVTVFAQRHCCCGVHRDEWTTDWANVGSLTVDTFPIVEELAECLRSNFATEFGRGNLVAGVWQDEHERRSRYRGRWRDGQWRCTLTVDECVAALREYADLHAGEVPSLRHWSYKQDPNGRWPEGARVAKVGKRAAVAAGVRVGGWTYLKSLAGL